MNEKAKIISMTEIFVAKKKQKPLSKLMVKTLVKACAWQCEGRAFGPADIDGSFSNLVERGLIKFRDKMSDKKRQASWFVTEDAFRILKTMGIEIC